MTATQVETLKYAGIVRIGIGGSEYIVFCFYQCFDRQHEFMFE